MQHVCIFQHRNIAAFLLYSEKIPTFYFGFPKAFLFRFEKIELFRLSQKKYYDMLTNGYTYWVKIRAFFHLNVPWS